MPANLTSRAGRATKWREPMGFRPIPGTAYPVGALLQLAPLDLHVDGSLMTARLAPAAAGGLALVGLVADEWATGGTPAAPTAGGFDGRGLLTAPGTVAAAPLGTDAVPMTVRGTHMRALIDNTAGTAAIVHGSPLGSSAQAAGKLAFAAATTAGRSPGAVAATALLESAAPFNTLGSGALTAATQTVTVGGAPAVGDVYAIPLQIPFSAENTGVAQYRVVVVGPLTAGQAASTTTAAAAIAAAITADSVASVYYTATSALAVVTLTVVAGNQFRITNQGLLQQGFYFGANWELTTSGTVGNSLTIGAMTATGGGTLAASGAAAAFTGYPAGATLFSGGAGYVGTCPVFVTALFG